MAPTTPKSSKKAASKKAASPTTSASPSPRIRKPHTEAPDLGIELTFILVGSGPMSSRETFVVHKNLLMSISGFFARGLTSSFKEAESGVFEMEEEDPIAFTAFIHWVYFNRLFTMKTAPASATEEDQDEWNCLPRLYTLGERLDAPHFKDAVISATIEKMHDSHVMPDNWAPYIYQNTVVANCALRRLIVDFHVFAHQGKLLKKGASPDAEEPEVEFLQDVVARIVDVGQEVFGDGGVEMPWTEVCGYHEHGDGACRLLEEGEARLSVTAVRRSARSTVVSVKRRFAGIPSPLNSGT